MHYRLWLYVATTKLTTTNATSATKHSLLKNGIVVVDSGHGLVEVRALARCMLFARFVKHALSCALTHEDRPRENEEEPCARDNQQMFLSGTVSEADGGYELRLQMIACTPLPVSEKDATPLVP